MISVPETPASRPAAPARTGEYLVSKGLINGEELALARQIQQVTRERLGQILLTLGLLRRLDLYRSLGEMWGVPFVQLTQTKFDEDLARRLPMEDVIARFVIPMRIEGQTLVAAVADRPTAELTSWLLEHYDDVQAVVYEAATDWDVDWAIRKVYRARLLESSVYGLYVQNRSQCFDKLILMGIGVAA